MTKLRVADVLWSLEMSSKPVGEDVSDKNNEELRELTGRSEPIELGVPGIDVCSALTKSCEMDPIELKLSTRAGGVVANGSVVGELGSLMFIVGEDVTLKPGPRSERKSSSGRSGLAGGRGCAIGGRFG